MACDRDAAGIDSRLVFQDRNSGENIVEMVRSQQDVLQMVSGGFSPGCLLMLERIPDEGSLVRRQAFTTAAQKEEGISMFDEDGGDSLGSCGKLEAAGVGGIVTAAMIEEDGRKWTTACGRPEQRCEPKSSAGNDNGFRNNGAHPMARCHAGGKDHEDNRG